MTETRGEMVVQLLEKAAQLVLHASDLMKLTDEDGVIWAGPKAHQLGAVVDLLYALSSEMEGSPRPPLSGALIDGQVAP